jgi:DNA-binding CsgD family transcriptional regulator
MSRLVVISTPSYIIKKGLNAIIKDIEDIELIFLDNLSSVNHHLETLELSCVIIDQAFIEDKHERDLLFQLKKDTIFIALTRDQNCLPRQNKYDHIIRYDADKEKVIPILEQILQKTESIENSTLLSEREIDVLKLVALGFTNQQIADKLFISKHTVISHRKNITSKLGIKTVSGLTVYAVLNNLIPKDQIQ